MKGSWLDSKGPVNHSQRPIKILPAQKEAPHWLTHKRRSCASHSVILINWCCLKTVIFMVASLFLFIYVYVWLSRQFVWCFMCMYHKSTLPCIIKKKNLHEYFETMNVACYVFYIYMYYLFKMIYIILKWKNQNEYINRKFEKYKFKPYLNSFTCEYIRCTAYTWLFLKHCNLL